MSEIDDAALRRLAPWMAENVPGYRGPLTVNAFDGGQSNPTFELVTPQRRYVLRRKPIGRLLDSAHAVEREFRVLAATHPTGLPTPRPLALCEDEAVIGSAFYVMEKVVGRIFRDPTLPGVAPEARPDLYRAAVAALAQLHALDPAALGLATFGRPGNYMARQVARWTRQYRASAARQIPAMERLIAWLPQTIPAQDRTTLVHGDFKIDNLVFAPDAPRVAAILDWELSTTGEPICDLTYLLLNWVEGPIHDLPDRAAAGIPELEALTAEYCRLTARADLPPLDWFFSYNLFRLAAIVEGVVGRAREGTARDPQAAALAERPPRLAEAAWRYAQHAGAVGSG